MGNVTSPYEHIPQRVGHEERDAAVQRLRANLDAGRLDKDTFDKRAAAALTATTQDDLDPLFADLPPVATSGTFELYPHQSVATTPSPYLADPVPAQPAPTPETTAAHWLSTMPTWGKIIVIVAVAALAFGFLRSGMWWLIFFLPAIFGRWNTRSRSDRDQNSRWHDARR